MAAVLLLISVGHESVRQVDHLHQLRLVTSGQAFGEPGFRGRKSDSSSDDLAQRVVGLRFIPASHLLMAILPSSPICLATSLGITCHPPPT